MRHIKTDKGYIIRLDKGEDVFEEIKNFAEQKGITAAEFNGIGAVANVEIGSYNLEKKEYDFRTLKEPLEVVSMIGNVALVDGEQFLHIHAVLSDPDLTCYGGHMNKMLVHVTLEVFLTPHNTKIVRELDEAIGLKLCTFPDAN